MNSRADGLAALLYQGASLFFLELSGQELSLFLPGPLTFPQIWFFSIRLSLNSVVSIRLFGFLVQRVSVLGYARVVPRPGRPGIRSRGNWRVLGAGAAPNPDKPPGSVPVPGGPQVWAPREGPGRGGARSFLFKMSLTGEEMRETDESKRFFAPRATPHTKPGVDAGNGAFGGFVLALNKQATAGSGRWGLGQIFSHFFRFFLFVW